MCEYITKKQLGEPRTIFEEMFKKARKKINKQGIHFEKRPIGSGKRNMVIKQCNRDIYDLDYQFEITKLPKEWDVNSSCKKIKNIFREALDQSKLSDFTCFEDSTQALTTKSLERGFGYDIIITIVLDDKKHILYNKKNTNSANNNDYFWAERSAFKGVDKNIKIITESEHVNYLRDNYKNKRHEYKDHQEPNKKKSYQILNESIQETIKKFNIK